MSRLLSCGVIQQRRIINLKNDLVSVWNFDETSGTTAYDCHGDHDGTIGSSIVMNESGKISNCFKFVANDINSNVVIPDHDDFSFTDGIKDRGFSFSAWVKFRIVPNSISEGYIVSKRNWVSTLEEEWQFNYYHQSGNFNANFFDGGLDELYGSYHFTPNTASWYHLVATYDGSSNKYGCRAYVNAIFGGIQGLIGTYNGATNGSKPIHFGKTINANLWFDGWINQAAIWKRRININEIKALYNEGNGLDYNEW